MDMWILEARKCPSIKEKDGHGHVTLQRSRLHVGQAQMAACCFIAWFLMDVMTCPNGGSWPGIICSGAALMEVSTMPLLMVLRRLERNWEDGSMGKSPCSAGMKSCV